MRINIKKHLTSLLQHHKLYWQQRGKVKWVTLGSEKYKNFKSMTIIHKRNNNIASLVKADESIVTSHDEKTTQLRSAVNERLGQTKAFDIPQIC